MFFYIVGIPSQPRGAVVQISPDMIVNSSRAFILISDLSVTARKTRNSSTRGQDTENGGTSGHPNTEKLPELQPTRCSPKPGANGKDKQVRPIDTKGNVISMLLSRL